MKNSFFTQISVEEKQQYLAAALRNSSGGALDDKDIGQILPNICINSQYTIKAFSDKQMFCEAVARTRAKESMQTFLFSRAGQMPVAVIISPLSQSSAKKERKAVYILAPNLHLQKGTGDGQTI